jgi:hypothetical protein
MPAGAVARVLDTLGVRPASAAVLKDVPSGNGNWLLTMPDGQRVVLRRYQPAAKLGELEYEHAVLAHLAAAG